MFNFVCFIFGRSVNRVEAAGLEKTLVVYLNKFLFGPSSLADIEGWLAQIGSEYDIVAFHQLQSKYGKRSMMEWLKTVLRNSGKYDDYELARMAHAA